MAAKKENVIITQSLDGLGTDEYKDYLAHSLCLGGSCTIVFNGKELAFGKGDLMIVRKGKLVEKITPGPGFSVKTIFVTAGFIELSTPQSNYGMRGQLALFLNPVMHLDAEQQELCRRNFDMVEFRLAHSDHHFHHDVMTNVVQNMILDFFDFHSHIYGDGTGEDSDISTQHASLMKRFLSMLDDGEFRKHREVTYYADRLCVTSKYLSEVSKKVSGYAANYWINRYTMLDISRLLRDKSVTFVEISDMFEFSSPAYFTRYVQHNLGVNPSEYRD